MIKRNLKPQQAEPVQREIYTTSSMGRGLEPLAFVNPYPYVPFAGDDAE
jgi:prenylated cyclic peptide (anacyclamide/piricyclamide family)